mmetsp:Transcript_5498/g.22789  ORF Transcript_5498/g.22789 Transcript_5498/m.22789 type:complete len:726 (-) Transcript_5498:267-2444(-)
MAPPPVADEAASLLDGAAHAPRPRHRRDLDRRRRRSAALFAGTLATVAVSAVTIGSSSRLWATTSPQTAELDAVRAKTKLHAAARETPAWQREPDFEYELELMYIAMQLDGKQKNVLSFNGMGAQGPTIRVPLGAVVRVTVTNSLPDQGTTLHFHGVHQIGTPFFDGAHGVTQGAIPPMGESMTYQFVASPAGTHWYHSHLALQYADGAKGMFVVYDDTDGLAEYYDAERYVMFYDWLPKLSSAEYYVLGQVFGNSMHVMATGEPGEFENWVPAAGLVNGKPGLRSGDPIDAGYVLDVPVGHTLRVRLCFGGWLDKASVSVEGHDVLVVAKDGARVAPVRATTLLMHPAERFDVLLEARADAQPGDEYRIEFAIRDHAEFPVDKENVKPDDWTAGARPFLDDPSLLVFTRMKGLLNATLRYVAAPHASRVGRALAPWAPDAETDVLDVARDPFSTNLGSAGLHLDARHEERPPQLALGDASVLSIPVVLNGGFLNPTTGAWVYPHAEQLTQKLLERVGAVPFTIDDAPLARRVVSNNFWLMNNNSWSDPVVPLYLSKAKFGLSTTPGFATLVYDVPLNAVVDLVVVAHGNAGVIESHPMHFHGHRFWVVLAAKLPLLSSDEILDADDADAFLDGLAYNLVDPPLHDTYPIVTGYFYVLRFEANNPGFWHFHCHFLMHGVAGMQMVLNVGEGAQPAPPKMYYDGQDLNGMLCPPASLDDARDHAAP